MSEPTPEIKRYGWCEDGHEPDLFGDWVYYYAHREAVTAERERCAKIAEKERIVEVSGRTALAVTPPAKGYMHLCFEDSDTRAIAEDQRAEIAAAIRKGDDDE